MGDFKNKLYRILKWSERYTKTDMVYLTSGGFWITSGYIINSLISFGVTLILGYFLTKEEYGNYRYVLTLFTLFSAITLTGVGTALVQSVAKGNEGAYKQAVSLSYKWSFLGIIGAFFGAGYYVYFQNYFLGFSLVMIAISLPFINALSQFSYFLNGKKDFSILSLYNLLSSTVPLIFVSIFVFFTKNLLLIIFIYFFSNILIRYHLHKRTQKIFKPNEKEDSEIEKYSIKLSLLNALNHVAAHIDKVVVFTYLGSVELAIYSFATIFPDQIRFTLKNFSNLLVPKFTENVSQNKEINIKGKTYQILGLTFLITLMYLLLAPFLYKIFIPKYQEAVLYSQLFALIIPTVVAIIPNSLFIAKKNETKYAKATLGGSAILTALLFPFVHFWGLTGVLLSRILGGYIILGISYYLLKDNKVNE